MCPSKPAQENRTRNASILTESQWLREPRSCGGWRVSKPPVHPQEALVSEWVARYGGERDAGLEDRSSAPHRVQRADPGRMEAIVLGSYS
jgi:hypothetical protein